MAVVNDLSPTYDLDDNRTLIDQHAEVVCRLKLLSRAPLDRIPWLFY